MLSEVFYFLSPLLLISVAKNDASLSGMLSRSDFSIFFRPLPPSSFRGVGSMDLAGESKIHLPNVLVDEARDTPSRRVYFNFREIVRAFPFHGPIGSFN